jgi:hypothetical protein
MPAPDLAVSESPGRLPAAIDGHGLATAPVDASAVPGPAGEAASDAGARRRKRLGWVAYFGFWLATGLLLALAEWQHYVRYGGAHPWEPFLWELSSVPAVAVLGVAVWRWDGWLVARPRPLLMTLLAHAAGAVVFTVAHTVFMYVVRWIVYHLVAVDYEPGTAAQVFGYEAAKDVVTYVILVAAGHALRALRRVERQATDLARLQAQLAEARLAHLQSQIQPHFLFNTLNLISSVMYEDVERADVLIAELADLLRQAEAAGRRPVHALADELRWVRPFLSIMRQRFGDRLEATLDVSPEAARCEVPSLLLMGPVENAVTHGVAASAGPVRIEIAGAVVGDRLVVTVSDESATRANPATAPVADALPPTGPGRGTGLSNTRARLEAHYGALHAVALTREGGRAMLRLELPARPAAPVDGPAVPPGAPSPVPSR